MRRGFTWLAVFAFVPILLGTGLYLVAPTPWDSTGLTILFAGAGLQIASVILALLLTRRPQPHPTY